MKKIAHKPLSRRGLLQGIGLGTAGLLLERYSLQPAAAQTGGALPGYTGPEANPYWNAVGPYVTYPQKLPLLRLTDRPVQLETPRHYFNQAFTPNEATFVRYHLPGEPNSVDMTKWRLQIEGKVNTPLSLSLSDLLNHFEPAEVAAVMQCSGNSRSFFQPRIPGGQWGNGAMANALWTGVRLSDLIKAAGLKAGAVEIQFQGLDFGKGPKGYGSHAFMKSWHIDDPVLERAIVAYAMNGEPLPMLNGFPVRMVFPGKFATYWLKHVTWIRVLDHEDSNFWMAKAYRIPDTANGATTPEAVATGEVRMIPIGNVNLPVRSFLISPDGSSKIPAGLPTMVRGIAFSGTGPVVKVEISSDNSKSWHPARLGKNYGPYSFRTWQFLWTPRRPGQYTLAVRATDAQGHIQPVKAVWNPGGYLLNNIQHQTLTVGPAA